MKLIDHGNGNYEIEPGFTVLCDFCDRDYTTSNESGGILFQSKAVCPTCTPRIEASARRYNEQYLVRARCPEGTSFADWVRDTVRSP